MKSDFALILACYRSGQMSERQWQTHIEDAGFKHWLAVNSIRV